MSAKIDDLKTHLSRAREINISVTGRKSGRTISLPVWFVLDGDKVLLLPVSGSETQWYKNVLKNPSLQVSSGGANAELSAVPITSSKEVAAVADKFRTKYGAGEIKKYYSKLDVAVVAEAR
jgi:deazaflavin-dependent oxidoreductase (nitroreductase family)